MTGNDQLAVALRRLVDRVSHWTAPRWAVPGPGGVPRADLLYALVQEMADRAADVEGQPRRTVPSLANELALTDQLRVMIADLRDAQPDSAVLTAAADRIAAVNRALS
jgi:hypothetical protein